MSSPAASAGGPVRESERIVVLDVVRGVAILGILPVNLLAFAWPLAGIDTVHFLSPAREEAGAYVLLQALFQFKFITIFSLLFGVGIALQYQRARQRGSSLGGRYVWRNLLLLGIGAAHAWLLWYGDILFWYALIGLATFWLVRLPLPWLGALSAALITLPIGIALLFGIVLSGADAVGMQGLSSSFAGPETAAEALARDAALSSQPWDLDPGREILVFREGSYLDQLAIRLVTWGLLGLAVCIYYMWRLAGLFLLGMVLHRLGVFSRPQERRRLLNLLIALGLGVGLPVEVLRAAFFCEGSLGPGAQLLWDAAHQLTSLLLALGYVACILRLPPRWLSAAPGRALAATGRMALSNYLLETVLGILLCYSFGLGLFGRLTRVELWGVWLAIALALPVLSRLWLGSFRFGPVEWVWRSATFTRVQPLRRG